MSDDIFIKAMLAAIPKQEHEPLTRQEVDDYDRVIKESSDETHAHCNYS